ncbi:MAG: GH32 C-terminal domain-containing protein [Bacteroidales bacterium]|nr:GH32 C-terminal domain-containing protein [Bacteroidales bacterium]
MSRYLMPLLCLMLAAVSCGPAIQESIDGDGNYAATLKAKKTYILIPSSYSGKASRMDLEADGASVFEYVQDVTLAKDAVDYWIPVDVSACKGREVTLRLTGVSQTDPVYGGLRLSDTIDMDYDEPLRMVYHFTPLFGWNNDPNGLFYRDGVWHMYFQHNPYSVFWGNMTWGHATSKDLIHWKQHDNVLHPDPLGAIFSGSAVVDKDNTAGFGKDAVVAIYTSDRKGERQSIAYSTDDGYTFTKYSGNPVLADNPATSDFRDPKVYWIGGQWVMAISARQQVEFYGSPDLKNWRLLSRFGEGIGSHRSVWECPDLRKFEYEGKEKWVLFVTIGQDPNHANNTQYFIGDFDGERFTADPLPYPLWVDQGVNQYAGQTYFNAPDGRTVFLAWLTSSAFSSTMPATKFFTGGMTLPRELSLKSNGRHLTVASVPSPEVFAARGKASSLPLKAGERALIPGSADGAYEIDFNFTPAGVEPFGFILSNDAGEKVVYTFKPAEGILETDRTASGLQAFPREVASPVVSVIPVRDSYKVQLFYDRMVSEMFVNDGDAVATNCIYPSAYYDHVEVFGGAALSDVMSYTMK